LLVDKGAVITTGTRNTGTGGMRERAVDFLVRPRFVEILELIRLRYQERWAMIAYVPVLTGPLDPGSSSLLKQRIIGYQAVREIRQKRVFPLQVYGSGEAIEVRKPLVAL
jgi:hypothetical protein